MNRKFYFQTLPRINFWSPIIGRRRSYMPHEVMEGILTPSGSYSQIWPFHFFFPHISESVTANILLFLLLLFSHLVMSDSLWPHRLFYARLLSMGCPRQEHWNRLPGSLPGDLPDSGIKPASPALADTFFTTEPPGKPKYPATSS